MFKHILLAVDGSEHALKAATLAGNLARNMESDLLVVTVFEPVPSFLGSPMYEQAIAERLNHAEEVLNSALETVGEISGNLTTDTLEGPPAEAILEVERTRKNDLIIMGTHGRGRLSGLFLGSQSQKVVAHAKCPVLLVR